MLPLNFTFSAFDAKDFFHPHSNNYCEVLKKKKIVLLTQRDVTFKIMGKNHQRLQIAEEIMFLFSVPFSALVKQLTL